MTKYEHDSTGIHRHTPAYTVPAYSLIFLSFFLAVNSSLNKIPTNYVKKYPLPHLKLNFHHTYTIVLPRSKACIISREPQ